jgi:hypothetical protein
MKCVWVSCVAALLAPALAGAASVPFVANRGQVDERVAFYAPTFAGTVFATRSGELIYALPPQAGSKQGWLLKEVFVGGEAKPTAGTPAVTNVSVLTDDVSLPVIPTSRSVRFGEVWDGVDVEVHARNNNIEKVFSLAAGVPARRIALRIDGAKSLSLGEGGSLITMTGNGAITFAAPIAYQESPSGRRSVDVRYTIDGATYGFELGAHDTRLPVVIDPIIQSTYFGGAGTSFGNEGARDMAIHPVNGEVYIAGFTDSVVLPGTAGGAVPTAVANTGFVARFSADLTTLLQATYFAGNTDEIVNALVVTATDVYIAGQSTAGTLPAGGTPGAQPTDPNAGSSFNGFIVRLPLSLTSITASTFVGGSSNRTTQLLDIVLHSNGDLYGCGLTESASLPNTAGGFDATNPFQDRAAFVVRINAALTAFQQLTYFTDGAAGGNGAQCNAIVADATTNELYIGGTIGFGPAPPNLTGGVLTTGNSGAWLARLNAALTQNPQSTWIATTASGTDPGVFGLLRHPTNGDLYVLTSGRNGSPLPANATTNGGQATCPGTFQCMVVLRLATSLTSVVNGTFYGAAAAGSPIPRGFNHMAIDPASGDVFIGSDGHTGLPNTAGGFQPAPLNAVGTPGFVARIRADLGQIIQASYLSGAGTSGTTPYSVAIHPVNSDFYVAGATGSDSFPNTSGGAQAAFGGTADGFISRITPDLLGGPASAGTLQFSPATYNVTEGNVNAQITVTRTSGSTGAISVQYATSNGTATAGSDYTAASGTLNWANGDTAAKTIDITITDDALAESAETVNLTISSATGGATIGSQSTATLTITDNDGPAVQPGTVQFGAATYSANENGGSVTLTLTRTNGADGAISVSVASGGGSAAASTDYTALSQTVSWANGDAAAKTVVLQVLEDSVDEPNETVNVTISSPSGGATIGAQASATVTIVDNDPAPPGPATQSVDARGSYGGGAMGWFMVIIGIAFVLAPALGSAAERAAGWYVGMRGGVAKSTLDAGEFERALAARGHSVEATVDDGDPMAAVFGGYRWANGLGLEGVLVDLSEYDVTLSGTTTNPAGLLQDAQAALADAGRGLGVSLTWSWPFAERFDLTARVGGYYWESERELDGSFGRLTQDESGFDGTAGLSVTMRLSQSWSLGAGWEVWDAGDRNDVRAWTAVLTYRFGGR